MDTPPKMNLFKKISQSIKQAWNTIKPGPTAWKAAGWGVAILTFLLAFAAYGLAIGNTWYGIPLVITLAVFVLLAFLSNALLDLILLILNRIPTTYRWLSFGSIIILSTLIYSIAPLPTAIFVLVTVLVSSLLGAAVFTILRGGLRSLPAPKKVITWLGLVLGTAGLAAGIFLYFWPGPAPKPIQASPDSNPLTITAADPSQPGGYTVKTLTYGSGKDLHRPEYGKEAALITQSVNGSALIDNWSGFSGNLRTRYWGFDASALPINGRVWYPEGDGPFPLVLVVHGNHNMIDYSDPGYDYLGELLASRGYIFVSVDENFLNGGFVNIQLFGIKGIKGENDARGWLLLEHFRTWQTWNQDASSPFYQKVDFDKLAVMGHSRGGEAAYIAAGFNHLPAYPENANLRFNYDFDIDAVVSIAPVDGQYMPAGARMPLENVNYLVIQGAHDADLQPFMGTRMFNRVKFTDGNDWFKAAIYIDRANHGQFNSTWGNNDYGSLIGYGITNRKILLSKSEQEQVAKVYISAFLEAALRGETAYLPVFRDPRAAQAWLPQTRYLSQFENSRSTVLANFDEDINPFTATWAGTSFSSGELTLWYENQVDLKWDNQKNQAVYLGWDRTSDPSSTPRFSLELPKDASSLWQAEGILYFSLADANKDNQAKNNTGSTESDKQKGQKQEPPARQPVDFTILLIDSDGDTARLPLSYFALLQPQFEGKFNKADFLNRDDFKLSEPVFQTFEFPLSAFVENNPKLDLAQIRFIRFIFDRTETSAIILDNIGIRSQP